MGQEGNNKPYMQATSLASKPRRITSNELLGNDRRLIIEHEGAEYSLNLTRSMKLILTK